MCCIKIANKQNEFKQNLRFEREKEHVQRFNFHLLQTFHCRKCNSIFAASVMDVGFPLQNLKVCFGFLCRYQKINWQEQYTREIENIAPSSLLKAHPHQQYWCNFLIRTTSQSFKFFQQQNFNLKAHPYQQYWCNFLIRTTSQSFKFFQQQNFNLML